MTFSTVLIVALVIFVVIVAWKGVKIVPQAHVMVIERLGRYRATLQTGFNLIIPFIDSPRAMEWKISKKGINGRSFTSVKMVDIIDLREGVYDFPQQNVITRDNVVIEIDAIIYFQITDARRALYEISNLHDAIEKLAKTTLRNIIGDMDLDETLSSRDVINGKMTEILDEATDKWGVKVNRVEIQDINPPQDIKDAMEKQMRAERDRRAVILVAEGEKQSRILESEGYRQKQINEADGEKQSQILHAEGEAEARIKIAQAEAEAVKVITSTLSQTQTDPANYLIALKYMETLRSVAEGQDNKVVYLPYEATAVLGSLGGIKGMFEDKKL